MRWLNRQAYNDARSVLTKAGYDFKRLPPVLVGNLEPQRRGALHAHVSGNACLGLRSGTMPRAAMFELLRCPRNRRHSTLVPRAGEARRSFSDHRFRHLRCASKTTTPAKGGRLVSDSDEGTLRVRLRHLEAGDVVLRDGLWIGDRAGQGRSVRPPGSGPVRVDASRRRARER
jgi:hypothetical protein